VVLPLLLRAKIEGVFMKFLIIVLSISASVAQANELCKIKVGDNFIQKPSAVVAFKPSAIYGKVVGTTSAGKLVVQFNEQSNTQERDADQLIRALECERETTCGPRIIQGETVQVWSVFCNGQMMISYIDRRSEYVREQKHLMSFSQLGLNLGDLIKK